MHKFFQSGEDGGEDRTEGGDVVGKWTHRQVKIWRKMFWKKKV